MVLGVFLPLSMVPAADADDCAQQLEAARTSYQLGRLDQVLELVDDCLGSAAPPRLRARALALRARAYIALDDPLAARSAVGDLLRVEPGFTSDPDWFDSPALERLLSDVRSRLRLETIQVSSVSKIPEPLSEAPAIVTVFDREELDRLQPRNLSDLLALTAGFLVERDQDDIVWGGRGVVTDNNQKYMIAIDGHRISNTNNFGVSPFHKSRYLIDIAERIEIVRGPGGVLWGPDAFLGMVNVVTRRPTADLEETREVELTYGPTDSTAAAAVSLQQSPTAETTLGFFASAVFSEGQGISIDLAGRGGFDSTPGSSWDRFEMPSLGLNARYEGKNLWLAGQIVHVEPSVEGDAVNGEALVETFDQAFVELGTRRSLGPGQELTVKLYGDSFKALSPRSVFGETLRFPELRLGLEVLYERQWSRSLASVVGWDSRWHDYESAGEVFPGSPPTTTAAGSLFQNGLFAQLRARFDRLVVHAGARIDTFDDGSEDLLSSRLSIGYRASNGLYLKAIATTTSLRPSWAQLTAGFSFGTTALDTNLQAESLRSFELNAAHEGQRLASSLSLYRTEVDDTINFLFGGPRTDFGDRTGNGFYNFADYRTTGLEWEGRVRLGPDRLLFGNLTHYFDIERLELVGFEDPQNPTSVIPGTQQPYNIPDLFLRAGVTLRKSRPRSRLEVTPIARYKGRRLIQGIRGEAEDRKVDNLYIDLKARVDLGERLTLSLQGLNILDDDEIVGIGNGIPGFVVPKGATWEVSLRRRF